MHSPIRAAAIAASLFLLPALAHADIILKNKDGKSYQIAVRHSVAVTRTDLPARSYLIVTEGAETVQLRDGDGNPKGDIITVVDGDRLEVRGGKLTKTSSATTAER
jgi:hypothetical protein